MSGPSASTREEKSGLSARKRPWAAMWASEAPSRADRTASTVAVSGVKLWAPGWRRRMQAHSPGPGGHGVQLSIDRDQLGEDGIPDRRPQGGGLHDRCVVRRGPGSLARALADGALQRRLAPKEPGRLLAFEGHLL